MRREQLYEIKRTPEAYGLNVQLIEDSGRTGFNGVTTPTCLCIRPHNLEKFEGITTDLKLL